MRRGCGVGCRKGEVVRAGIVAYRCAIVQQLGARFGDLRVVLNEEGRRRNGLRRTKLRMCSRICLEVSIQC